MGLQSAVIEEIGSVTQAGRICNQHFDCVMGDDHIHDVVALIILGRRTDIQVVLRESNNCCMLNSSSNTNNIKVLLDLMSRITMGFWL